MYMYVSECLCQIRCDALSLSPSRSVASADQTSLDHSERASLDSKASTEASVASGEIAQGEVAIGNLIDIAGKSSD